jgi:hypothetical protein
MRTAACIASWLPSGGLVAWISVNATGRSFVQLPFNTTSPVALACMWIEQLAFKNNEPVRCQVWTRTVRYHVFLTYLEGVRLINFHLRKVHASTWSTKYGSRTDLQTHLHRASSIDTTQWSHHKSNQWRHARVFSIMSSFGVLHLLLYQQKRGSKVRYKRSRVLLHVVMPVVVDWHCVVVLKIYLFVDCDVIQRSFLAVRSPWSVDSVGKKLMQ